MQYKKTETKKRSEEFHERLVRLRQSKKVSASELAAAIGVSSSTYRAWEYGRAIQGPHAFVRLSRALEVSLGELMDGRSSEYTELVEKLSNAEVLLSEIRRALLSLK